MYLKNEYHWFLWYYPKSDAKYQRKSQRQTRSLTVYGPLFVRVSWFYWSFVLYERPILGDHPKAHSEKRCGFHENCCFSWKLQCFSWKVAVFMKSSGFYEKQQFSWNVLQFSWKAHEKQLIEHKSAFWTWSFIEDRGEANKVYPIFLYLVLHMFGGACVVHVCVSSTYICT